MYEINGELQASQLAERLDSLKQKLTYLLKNCTPTKNELGVPFQLDIFQLQSRMSAKRPDRVPRRSPYLENLVSSYEERNNELEQREYELRRRLEAMESMAPAIMMFNLFRMMKNDNKDTISATIAQLRRVGGKDLSSTSTNQSFKPKTARKDTSIIYQDYEEKMKMLEAEHKKSSCMCIDIDEKIKALETERNKLIGIKQNMERKVRSLETQISDLKQFAPIGLGLGRASLSSLLSADYDI